MHCEIVSKEETIFSGLVEFVAVPGEMGPLGIFPDHTPLITRIRPGSINLTKQGGEEEVFYISGGTLEIQPNQVTLLVDSVST